MKTYNNDVMEAIRQRLGLEPDDNSKDEQIMNMDKSKAFQEYCLWNGLMGSYHHYISEAISSIYGVALQD